MVAAWIDGPGEGTTRRFHTQTIGQFLDIGANDTKVLHDDSNAVALLHAQLFGASDLQIDAGAGGNAGKERQLVDDRTNVASTHARASQRARTYSQIGDDFPAGLRFLDDVDACTHPAHDV